MAKHYVIPIDQHDFGYLGVKALQNPYNNHNWFCGGSPYVFGGNMQGGNVVTTLVNETTEESHRKVTIDGPNLNIGAPGGAGVNCIQLLHDPRYGGMTFYAMRRNFDYNNAAVLPPALAGQNAYRETTGQVVLVNLAGMPTADRAAAARSVTRVAGGQLGIAVPAAGQQDFAASESAEAIRLAAIAVQAGNI